MNKPTISPGLARLRANANGEAMRQRTIEEQQRAIGEVQALRATAGKPEDRWIPGNEKDYPKPAVKHVASESELLDLLAAHKKHGNRAVPLVQAMNSVDWSSYKKFRHALADSIEQGLLENGKRRIVPRRRKAS